MICSYNYHFQMTPSARVCSSCARGQVFTVNAALTRAQTCSSTLRAHADALSVLWLNATVLWSVYGRTAVQGPGHAQCCFLQQEHVSGGRQLAMDAQCATASDPQMCLQAS